MKRPPLHIYFLAHPKSAQGRILAESKRPGGRSRTGNRSIS
jgi:hypothetical protein